MHSAIHAILLASGLSQRLEGFNKLLLPCPSGKSLIEQGLCALTSTKTRTIEFTSKLLVYSDKKIEKFAPLYGFRAVYNADYTEGKAAGIRLAAQNAPEGNLLFIAADQYGTDYSLFEKIIKTAFQNNADVVFTQTQDGFGLPAFFSAKLRPFLAQISEEQGGKDALKLFEAAGNTPHIVFVKATKTQCADIDTWPEYFDFLADYGIRHILITGERGAGKTTLVNAISRAMALYTEIPTDGLRAYVNREESASENRLYIERIATGEKKLAARLRKSDKKILELNHVAFDEFASEHLRNAAFGRAPPKARQIAQKRTALIIDELGRIETDCAAFQRTILEILTIPNIHMLAVLQEGTIPFNTVLQNRSDTITLHAAY